MRSKFKMAARVALLTVAAAASVVVVVALVLIYPGTPSATKSLHFEGYVPLPSHTLLTVLDYITLDSGSLFVTDESGGNVYKVMLGKVIRPTGTEVSVLASEPATHGVAIDPVTHLAFVTRSEVNTVDVFDPGTMKLVRRIAVPEDPDAIAYDELDKLMYVAHGDARVATLIDPQTLSVVATIPLGGRGEFAVFDPHTHLMYQNLEDDNSTVAIDIVKRAVVGRISLDPCRAPSGMAIDERHRRLFVVCSENAMLAIVDMESRRVVESIAIGEGPDSVAFDPGLRRIYTTGKSGKLVVVQQDGPDTYRLLDFVALHYGAHTLAVDSTSHALYVGYAGLVVGPRLAVFTAIP